MVAFLELTKDLVSVPANYFGAIFIDVEIVKIHGPVCVVFAIQTSGNFSFHQPFVVARRQRNQTNKEKQLVSLVE